MEKWTKKRLIKFSLVVFFAASLYAFTISSISINGTLQSANELTWKQSVERQLQQQNENYQEDIYERYSKTENLLTTYQSITNQRMNSLEDRVGELERSVRDLEKRVKDLQENPVCFPNLKKEE